MSDAFVGEIRMFAGNFAPTGWALCDGSILAISQNTALFSLLGTQYGGNGQTTFALPDLRDRAPMAAGGAPSLTSRVVGETGGAATVTLTSAEVQPHGHTMLAANADTDRSSPTGSAAGLAPTALYRPDADSRAAAAALSPVGADLPHENRQPYLQVTFIIALTGIFPPRS